jgi:hypothetical protein
MYVKNINQSNYSVIYDEWQVPLDSANIPAGCNLQLHPSIHTIKIAIGSNVSNLQI